MIKRMSESLAEKMVYLDKINNEEVEMYAYCFEIAIATLLNLLISVLISLFFMKPLEFFMFVLGFVPMRMLKGGFHAKNHLLCTSILVIVLHKAIVIATNNFCEVKDDVAEILRESITEVLDPTKNGSVLAAQQRLDELAHNMNKLLQLATTPESSKAAMADIQKFSDEMKALREFIETEKAKTMTVQQDTEQMNAVLERLEQTDFMLTEYEDAVVRQIVEKISVVDKQIIRIRFVGGMEVVQSL